MKGRLVGVIDRKASITMCVYTSPINPTVLGKKGWNWKADSCKEFWSHKRWLDAFQSALDNMVDLDLASALFQ